MFFNISNIYVVFYKESFVLRRNEIEVIFFVIQFELDCLLQLIITRIYIVFIFDLF